MATTIAFGGYATYEDYKKDHTYTEIGEELIDGINNKVEDITKISNIFKDFQEKLIENDIIQEFLNIRQTIKEVSLDLFDGIVDFFTKIYNWIVHGGDDDFVYGGGGYGGGAGGAR